MISQTIVLIGTYSIEKIGVQITNTSCNLENGALIISASNGTEADFSLRDALVALKEITGQEPGKLLVIADGKPLLDPPLPDNQTYWVEVALKNNLDFLPFNALLKSPDVKYLVSRPAICRRSI